MSSHYAHRAYIAAIESALMSAGFETLEAYADSNDPRDGAIQIDTTKSGADWFSGWAEVWLGWNEDRGWWIVCQEQGDGEPNRFVIDLPVMRVASPASVVHALADKAGVQVDPADEHPDRDFPEHAFEDDDPAFELALRYYEDVS